MPYGQMSLWGGPCLFLMNVYPVSSDLIKPTKVFMGMLMGFIDGGGYFDIGEQKQYNKKNKSSS